jgi:hypothetical protein
MNYYIFNIDTSKKGVSEIATVIFDTGISNKADLLVSELKKHLIYNSAPDIYYYIIPQNFSSQGITDFLSSKAKVSVVQYNQDGIIDDYDLKLLNTIREEGLKKIFLYNSGILQSDDSFHFVLPSGKHSKYFIRVGNVLCHYPHISFFALWILKYLNGNSRKIYYDSSSILSILIEAINITRRLDQPYFQREFENFNSYAGVKETNFSDNSLIIISASNSGNLAEEIRKFNLNKNLSFVFLTLNVEFPKHQHIINLYGKHEALLQKQYLHEIECKYCTSNSTPVIIAGEQFLPARSKIKQVLFREKDLSEKVRVFLIDFIGEGLLTCNYKDREKFREVFFDLENYHKKYNINQKKILKGRNEEQFYNNELLKYLENNISTNVSLIVHLRDKSSKEIAKQVQKYLSNKLKVKPKLLEFGSSKMDTLDKAIDGVILVVASSIVTGNRINPISTYLRDFNNASIHYLICILRTDDEEKVKKLKLNLEWRNNKSKSNKVSPITEVYLPNRHSSYGIESLDTPWKREERFLLNLIKDGCTETYILSRYDLLTKNNSLVNGLFWNNILKGNQAQLHIRRNFAFFDFDKYKKDINNISQSEIYFIILCLIHNIRNRKEDAHTTKLEQHEHIRTLIDPHNFLRFSDGIIQASILRAANPSELNYSVSHEISHQAANILINIFKSKDSDNSEAILEFLYAIACGNLNLLKSDLNRFVEEMKKVFKKYKEVCFFLDLISKNETSFNAVKVPSTKKRESIKIKDPIKLNDN